MFPDIELVVVDLIAPLVMSAGTRTPIDFASKMPFAKVARIGGSDNGITDRPRVDVEVFTPDRSGRDVSESIRQRLLRGPHLVVLANGRRALIDTVGTGTGPTEVPYASADIRRWTASYDIECRRIFP